MAELNLGKQIGPLPLGGWVVVVGGGLAIGYFINRRMASRSDEPVQLTEGGVGAGGTGGFVPVSPPPPAPPEADTNEKWATRVINWMVANNYPPNVADNAVRRYLQGQALSPQEEAIINLAFTHFGRPPEPLPGPEPSLKPAAVSGLAVKSVTDRRIEIVWLPVPGAEHYEVVASSAGGTWGAQKTVVPYWINHSPFGTNMEHMLTVWAVNEFGKSEPKSISAKTKPLGQTAPTNPAPSPPRPTPAPAPAPGPRTHTVASGDTLWGIAQRFYGAGSRWREIYNANAGTIESVARSRGKSSSRGGPNNEVGWWIFPGTSLAIP